MKTTLHYFTGITTCLNMVSGLAWQANVDNNSHFLTLENHFLISKILFFNIRKLVSNIKENNFNITKYFLIFIMSF